MAFLISNYGKFASLKLPDYQPLKVRNIKETFETFEVSSETPLEVPKKDQAQIRRKVLAYKKMQEHHELKHKTYYARDLMSSPVHTLQVESSLDQVKELMRKYEIHHVPIFEKETMVGIITVKDFLKAQNQIREIMSTQVITATANTRIQEVAKIMLCYEIHCLPIIDDKHQLVGIITEKDLLRLLANHFTDEFLA